MKQFIGREKELKQLENLITSGRASLVVIKGRRRIGKSRLAEEFGKGKKFLSFSGLAPVKGVSSQDQKDAFAKKISQAFNIPLFTFNDWSDGFAHLTRVLEKEPTVILFDEVSWMGHKDPTFTSKMKVWWDETLQNHHKLMLILCSSISTWIDKNIINSTAFFGRVSLYIELDELTLPESAKFLLESGFYSSSKEIVQILAVTGGVPWYLEQIHPKKNADENIRFLCFEKNSLLVNEFDRIFNDLFSSRGEVYKKIIKELASGMKERSHLRKSMGYTNSGTLSTYLTALETCGFITKHNSWSLKTGKTGKSITYRLSDNYLRFYLHYIEPNMTKIKQGTFSNTSISTLPGFEAILGYQIENLILKNRKLIYDKLGIYSQDIIYDNPFTQQGRGGSKGCQIDYLIHSKSNTLYLCEIKARRKELGIEVIDSLKKKAQALANSKGSGIAPVLIHLGPLSNTLLTSNYFFRIIDIEDLLSTQKRRGD